jgi:murein DD-endopeptidase MepM/ murein hydrolase activator NlpD
MDNLLWSGPNSAYKGYNMANSQSISILRNLFIVLVGCVVVGLVVVIWFGFQAFESETPTLALETPADNIGASYTLQATAADSKSGLKRVWIAIVQEGTEVVLLDQTFPSHGLLRKGETTSHAISLTVAPQKMGLKDGQALLRSAVWDYSYKGWGKGNQLYAEKPILIDTTAPVIEVLTPTHNLNQGGAGLTVYRTSEPVVSTGVQVGDHFFPGLTGYFDAANVFVAYFALPHDMGQETTLLVTAKDGAGNTGTTGLFRHINLKEFKKDSLTITDGFLASKLPEFAAVMGWGQLDGSLSDKFLSVNRDLRIANYETIRVACRKSDAKQYWTGPFLRLPNSAPRAGFADHRTYVYDGKEIDEQVHLGVDLASTAHSPVPVANNGRVTFTGDLGIYGRTVIVDHGFFLFSMYSHLNQALVTKDQMVTKGDIIGSTGTTGMAGGDHLHFSILVADTFVNPIEWWDPHWIEHNVTDKLEIAQKAIGPHKKEATP